MRPRRSISRARLAAAALAAAVALGLALPAAASAAEYTFAIYVKGPGEGVLQCQVKLPLEEQPYEEPCPEGYAESYPLNTKITVHPEPEEPGSAFGGFWNATGSAVANCQDGRTSDCAFTIKENSSIEAEFDQVMRSLTINLIGKGEGRTECESPEGVEPCEGTVEYPRGTEVTVYAEPEPGSKFGGFSSGTGSAASISGCSGAGPCSFTLEQDSAVDVRFDWFSLLVKVAGSGQGSVIGVPPGNSCSSECKVEVEPWSPVLLTASAATGSSFGGWSGCEGEGPEECTVALEEADAVVIATFNSELAQGEVPPLGEGSSPPPPPGEQKLLAGTARILGGRAPVKGGKALVKVACSGLGPCEGALKLLAGLRSAGHRKAKSTLIGRASFRLAEGASNTLGVRLSAAARRVLKGGGGLRARVLGTGIEPGRIQLR